MIYLSQFPLPTILITPTPSFPEYIFFFSRSLSFISLSLSLRVNICTNSSTQNLFWWEYKPMSHLCTLAYTLRTCLKKRHCAWNIYPLKIKISLSVSLSLCLSIFSVQYSVFPCGCSRWDIWCFCEDFQHCPLSSWRHPHLAEYSGPMLGIRLEIGTRLAL